MHRIDKSLFPQMVIVPLLSKHRMLTQVAGHNMDVIKILPPLMIGEKEVDYFVNAFNDALAGCRKFPGPVWELARNTARQILKTRRFARQEQRAKGNGVAALVSDDGAGELEPATA